MPDRLAYTAAASHSDTDSVSGTDDLDLLSGDEEQLPRYEKIDRDRRQGPPVQLASPSVWRNYFEAHLPSMHPANKVLSTADHAKASVEASRRSGPVESNSLAWTIREIFGRSWLYVMLVFVPFGVAAHVAGLNNPTVTFALNALAIVPLTGLLTYATELVASNLGVGLGAFLNITFGNMVELVIIFMLREGHLSIVLSSLIGSVFVNLLFILGIAIMSAGFRFPEQKYDQRVTQILVFFMTTGILSLLLPTSLHACVQGTKKADSVTLKFSRALSVPLLLIYMMFVHFQIRSGGSQHGPLPVPQAESNELELGKVPSPGGAGEGSGQSVEAYSVRMTVTPTGHVRSARMRSVDLGRKKSEKRKISNRAAVTLLILSALVVSTCADFMVEAIEHVVADAPLTEAFLGLIILPLLGNAAEMATAITVAVKNKIDLAINVTVGSAIQITLFMAPCVVLLGMAMGRNLSLNFDMFQTVALVATLLLVSAMMLSGRTNYLLGMLLCACYVIIGTGAFFLPNQHKKGS